MYEHPSLQKQATSGWRNFELDYHLRENAALIYHAQMWDGLSSCSCYITCLNQLNDWSDSNPDHFPIYVILEPKVRPFTEDAFTMRNDIQLSQLHAFEQQIIKIFKDKVVSPDLIRKGQETVK